MGSTTRLCRLMMISLVLLLSGCTFQGYKFNGASINYDEIKTIQFADFPIRSAYVWMPMHAMFNNALQDEYANHTKLKQVNRGGDLQLAGEIVEYSQINKGISANGYAAQTQLRMSVNVRLTNNKKHSDDFERRLTATPDYESPQQLTTVQEELVTQMIDDLVDQIYNATVANW